MRFKPAPFKPDRRERAAAQAAHPLGARQVVAPWDAAPPKPVAPPPRPASPPPLAPPLNDPPSPPKTAPPPSDPSPQPSPTKHRPALVAPRLGSDLSAAGLGTMSFRSRSVDFWATINGGALVELYKVVGSRDHARFVAAAMQLHGLTEGQANDALARFAEEEQWPIPSRTQSGGGGAGPSGVTPRAVVPATAPPIVGPRPNTLSLTRPRSVEGAPHVSQSGHGLRKVEGIDWDGRDLAEHPLGKSNLVPQERRGSRDRGQPSKLTKEGHQEKERFWARHGRQDIDRAGLPDRTLYARGGAMLETAEMELDDGARRWGYDPRFPLTYARYGPGAGYQ